MPEGKCAAIGAYSAHSKMAVVFILINSRIKKKLNKTTHAVFSRTTYNLLLKK